MIAAAIPAQAGSNFRADINGLRAWAVVVVILYHFNIPGFSGGFVGVDVFFGISGYLMTGIVVAGLARGNFSVWAFYMARARRIVPALLVLCTVLLVAGWWVLPSPDYQRLGWQELYSVGFLSNVQYWREANYFDIASHDKWLLHTWSLAVEWQFYLLLPLVLAGLWKLRPTHRAMAQAMVLGAVLSLALCVVLTPGKPTGTFFMLPTRAWEMLAGGLVWMAQPQLRALSDTARQWLEWVGLALVLWSTLHYTSADPWPGWRAVVPVAGCALVLLAARSHSVWTNNRLAQWLGTCSYSLYLWHWPVVVSLAYCEVADAPWAIALGLLLTLLLGALSYRWVEVPARSMLNRWLRSGAVVLVGLTALIGSMATAVAYEDGFGQRFSPQVRLRSAEAQNMNPRQEICHPHTGSSSPSCMFGGPQLGAILLGDSHGLALVTALAAAMPTGQGVMAWTYSACPILLGAHAVKTSPNQCSDFVDWSVRQLASIAPSIPVVIVNRHAMYAKDQNEVHGHDNDGPTVYFSKPQARSDAAFLKEYAQHLTATACQIAQTHPVYLVRPIPEMGVNVPNTARSMVWGIPKDVNVPLAAYFERNDVFWAAQDAARAQCGVKILDPTPYLCWDDVCHGLVDGRPIYYDDDHLSEFGNQRLVPMFREVFRKS